MSFLLTENLAEALTDVTSAEELGALAQYFQDSLPTILNFCVRVIIAVIVIFVGRWLIRVLRRALGRALTKAEIEEGVRQFFDRVVNVALWALLILLILARFGITASSVIAIIGSVGLSIGLALQGSLSNFAGGVLILITKPFKVGDYIADSNGNEGSVTEIKLFFTELTTIDNRVIVIPNADLSNSSLTNFSQQEKRIVNLTVHISYHADLALAKNVLTRLAEQEEKRLPEEPILVFVSDLGEYAVELGLRVWVATSDYWEVRWRLTEQIKLALDENHIEIPFPQVTVSYEEESGKKPEK